MIYITGQLVPTSLIVEVTQLWRAFLRNAFTKYINLIKGIDRSLGRCVL